MNNNNNQKTDISPNPTSFLRNTQAGVIEIETTKIRVSTVGAVLTLILVLTKEIKNWPDSDKNRVDAAQ